MFEKRFDLADLSIALCLAGTLMVAVYGLGTNVATRMLVQEAVKHGAAQYQVDQSGNVSWSWKGESK